MATQINTILLVLSTPSCYTLLLNPKNLLPDKTQFLLRAPEVILPLPFYSGTYPLLKKSFNYEGKGGERTHILAVLPRTSKAPIGKKLY